MDPNIPQTSFIPKQLVREEKAINVRSFSLINFVVTIIFFSSLAAAAGLYFYKGILESSIQDMNISLTRAKAKFEPGLITDLQVLDKRLNSSKEILSKHISISPIFRSLESLTLKSVRFSKFAYEIPNDKDRKIEVKMSGQTSPQGGYRSIALESNKLAENKYFTDIIFSNLSLTQSGGVSFDLTFSVDLNFLNFEKSVANL